jgi:Uncharacterized conserved protein (COG2071)
MIRRRILVNFRVDPMLIAAHLPAPFTPKLYDGQAIVGICLIRLEEVRPRRFPSLFSLSSENAAHRIAVRWNDAGEVREGVFIPRRDTGSLMNHLAGGRVFPGEHHRAQFQVTEDSGKIDFEMRSDDGLVRVDLQVHEIQNLPTTSHFASLEDASQFFKDGSVGYSQTANGSRLDGIQFQTRHWTVAPLEVDHVFSSFFHDPKVFPDGSVHLDCALIMRDVPHEWHSVAEMRLS